MKIKQEKKYFASWWMWISFLMISAAIIFALNSIRLIGRIVVERKVFEQSYQKQEADKTALTTYSSQLAQLRGKLNNPNIDAGTRVEIKSQIDAILILKSTKED